MARPRKILAAKSENSHLTKEQQEAKKKQEELIKTGKDHLKNVPEWLRDDIAINEWKRLIEELETIDAISNLDYNNLGAYCNSFSNYVELTKKMKALPHIIKHINKANQANFIPNPMLQVLFKYSEELRKYAGLLGLTIDSRLKFASLKIGKERSDLAKQFGDLF